MNKKSFLLTTSQFAALHSVNKRTLHYYDSIGLFSPRFKGENHYRYYDVSQSMEFEYIRMLKELHMRIDEIKSYLCNPNTDDFIEMIDTKSNEIDRQIEKLKLTKKLLQYKKEQALFCQNELHTDIQIVHCNQENLLTIPFPSQGDTIQELFSYIKNFWGMEQCRMGVGSYISLDKVQNNNFEEYDGLFTSITEEENNTDLLIKPTGRYLCGYIKGPWDYIPSVYKKMLDYAELHRLELTGYAFELGMNDFLIHSEEDSITQIMIGIK